MAQRKRLRALAASSASYVEVSLVERDSFHACDICR
jgi:hypothetical protein